MGARMVRLGQRTDYVPGSQNQLSCAGVSSVSVTFLIPVTKYLRRIDVMEEEAILVQMEEIQLLTGRESTVVRGCGSWLIGPQSRSREQKWRKAGL